MKTATRQFRSSDHRPVATVLQCLVCAAAAVLSSDVGAQTAAPPSIQYRIENPNERLEMVVNSSRILTMDQKIPQVQVNDPEILAVTVLSANEVQISAKKRGVTQVNLWTENKEIYTVDVLVYPDARELSEILRSQFPNASLRVVPTATSVIISGFVDEPNHVGKIIEIAEDYYPKVINHMSVSGVQQVLLQVKVMEVSRTKLDRMGVDWTVINSSGDFFAQGISGVLAMAPLVSGGVVSRGTENMSFGIVGDNTRFFALLEFLKRENLAKVLADPQLVTVSGRPAFFNSGGEFPILVPQSLGTISIEYKKFGTQVDFVPIVLGNGNIRLEVRPRVSEIDPARSVVINNTSVPGLRVREIETGVEMRSGQTLALAGLVYQRTDTETRKVPYVGDLPWVGALFRRDQFEVQEVELLIVVTPHLVEAMDPHEVPNCGPGMSSCVPNDCQFYFKGHVEVPKGPECPGVCPPGVDKGEYYGAPHEAMPYEGIPPGAVPYSTEPGAPVPGTMHYESKPVVEPLPPGGAAAPTPPADASSRRTRGSVASTTPNGSAMTTVHPVGTHGQTYYTYNPYMASSPQNPANPSSTVTGQDAGLIGPVGYDDLQ